MTYRDLWRKGLLPKREEDWYLRFRAYQKVKEANREWFKRMGFRK